MPWNILADKHKRARFFRWVMIIILVVSVGAVVLFLHFGGK